MPDPETAALLRSVLEDLCASVSPWDARARTNVAASLMEVARQGTPSIEELKQAGSEALHRTPTMWR